MDMQAVNLRAISIYLTFHVEFACPFLFIHHVFLT